MNIRPINDEYAATAQIAVDDLDEIRDMGFKSVVCHRPDDEDPGQPAFSEIAARAAERGIEARHIPVSGSPTPEAVRAMVDALDELPKPMLGYCRSGNRSTIIYQQTQHLR
jgi:uncharacterized protein (TIGR01244 family)